MRQIYKKELNLILGTSVGLIVVFLFLLLNALFLWFFDGDYNILEGGMASLNGFFALAPWLLLFILPAVTMRSFAEERQTGTLELLLTRPLSEWAIVAGKFFACFTLALLCLLPTMVYLYTVRTLALPEGNIDWGMIVGGYIGLILISMPFTAVGLTTSLFSKNQVTVFLTACFLNFLLFYGLEGLASYVLSGSFDYRLQRLGLYTHYISFLKGVIDTRALVYFFLVTVGTLCVAEGKLKNMRC